MKLFKQSAALMFACLVVLIITSTPLDSYKAPILGFLIIASVIGIVIKQRSIKKNRSASSGQAGQQDQDILSGSSIEVAIITMSLLLIIFMTGGLTSNLFFLLYFLVFGMVFLFLPETVFVLVLGIEVLFFTSLGNGDLLSNLIRVGSVAFLSPIAYFFGREFQRREKLEQKINDTTGQILEDAQTLLSHTKNDEAVDEIDDIIEKSNELRREAEKND